MGFYLLNKYIYAKLVYLTGFCPCYETNCLPQMQERIAH